MHVPLLQTNVVDADAQSLNNPRYEYASENDREIASWRRPASGDIYPFREATSFFAFNLRDLLVTSAATSHSILFRWIRGGPVVVLFLALLVVFRSLL